MIERARAIAWARADARLEAQVERSTADMRRRQGRFTEAMQGFGRAIGLAAPLNDPFQIAQDLLMQGGIALTMRDPARGHPPLERALALADSMRSAALQSQALTALARLAGIEGDGRAAEGLGARALARGVAAGDSELVHDAASALGQQNTDRGDFKAARPWAARALVAGRGLSEAEHASDLELAARVAAHSGRLDDAERDFRAALELANRIAQPDLAWRPVLGLGELAALRGEALKALEHERRAAGLVEALPAVSEAEAPSIAALGHEMVAFEALIHLLGKLEPRYPDSGFVAESFQWAERARAHAFRDLIVGSAARAGGDGPAAMAAAARTVSLKDLRAQLDSDRDVLLEYSVGDSSTSLWVVTRRDARHLLLAPRATLRAHAETFRRGLSDASGAERRSTIEASRALYKALIEPVEADLARASNLIVSADDALALIPFEALLSSDVAAENAVPAPGSYLVERFTVSYVPSASALAALTPAAKTSVVVALGDVSFGAQAAGGPAPAPLPNTAAELEALKGLAGSRRFVTLTGAAATRARLLALPELREAGLIHLATRAVADENEPGRSGLWLAPEITPAGPPQGPGFLAVDDILGLSLRSELVTLSGCETGLGRLERGEGILGLTRAFLAAGARSVLVSLWGVPGGSTAQLMDAFYRALLQRGRTREEALAGAKRALLAASETRSPYYWARFVIVGEGGKLR